MAALDFPASPSVGQGYGNWRWDGYSWVPLAIAPLTYTTISPAANPPQGPIVGNWWWQSDTGRLYIYYDDGNSKQWVGAQPGVTALALMDLAALGPNLNPGDVITANGPNDFGHVPARIASDFRNKVINGDFLFWQYGTSQTTAGYGSDDRWYNQNVGTTKNHLLVAHPVGQTLVPGNPVNFSRTIVTSVAGAGNNCYKFQRIEDVRTLSGRLATVTFWAKADAAKNIAVAFAQVFGTGGSPSATVQVSAPTTCALTTAWQKFSFTVQVPSIAGMTLGINNDHYLQSSFWFDAGSNFNALTNSLGQQSGTFDIAHVSLVDGDATQEIDPFTPRHAQQELALCQRYYETQVLTLNNVAVSTGSQGVPMRFTWEARKRRIPQVSDMTLVASGGSGSLSGGSVGFINSQLASCDCQANPATVNTLGVCTFTLTASAEL
jgi:hypothetical protein